MSMSSPVVVVDDRDQSIVYSNSGWESGGDAESFSKTLTFSLMRGSTATFTFSGTSVNVYGNKDHIAAANMTFRLDGNSEDLLSVDAQRDVFEGQALLWGSGTLNDTSHTLVMTQQTTLEDAPNGVIVLDHLTYTPSSNAQTDRLTYIPDDQDPIIHYSQDWERLDLDYFTLNSAMSSSRAGSSFVISFFGNGLSLFGAVSNETDSAIAEIILDNNSRTTWVANATWASNPPSPSESFILGQEIFTSSLLERGSHNLSLTLQNDRELILDYILITPGGSSAGPATITSTASLLSTSAGPLETSQKIGPSGTQPQNGGASNVAIAGGVVGGAIGLCLAALTIFCVLKRRRPAQSLDRSVPEPFVTPHTASVHTATQKGETGNSAASELTPGVTLNYSSAQPTTAANPENNPVTSSGTRPMRTLSPEVDSGWRDSDGVRPPPIYTPQ